MFRWCDGSYLEDQDFFRYTGVARDCYLYTRNKTRIDDIRVTPDLDGQYKNGSLDIELNLKGKSTVTLELRDASNQSIASTEIQGNGIGKKGGRGRQIGTPGTRPGNREGRLQK